jgi:ApaG protein
MTRAGEHRQPGIPRKPGVCLGERAAEETAAAVARDHAGVATGAAQAGKQGRLPGCRRIVHDEPMFTSEATTRGIRVAVVAEFSPARSRVDEQQWFFLYTITITNTGAEAVQLLSRHWVITDANGQVEEVKGPGVVGEQPVLEPHESFTYTSGCPLGTAFGVMEGTYQMVTRGGEQFDARIAPFTLSEPYTVH